MFIDKMTIDEMKERLQKASLNDFIKGQSEHYSLDKHYMNLRTRVLAPSGCCYFKLYGVLLISRCYPRDLTK
jgi:cell division FtsZ-interacting protein ZapD